MDTKKYQICKSVTFLLQFYTFPNTQPWDYIMLAEELLIGIIKLNKEKAREPSKYIFVLD